MVIHWCIVCSRPLWTLYSANGKQHVQLSKKVHVFTDISLLFPLGDSEYLALGMFADKRFCLLDNCGNEKMRFGDYPNKKEVKPMHWMKFLFGSDWA